MGISLNKTFSPSWRIPAWTIVGACVAIAFVVNFAGELFYTPSIVNTTVIAKESKAIEGKPKETLKIASGTIEGYRGSKVKKEAHLPEEVVKDDNKVIVASSHVEGGSDHPLDLTTTTDLLTGSSSTYQTTLPLPLFAMDSHGEAGVYLGAKDLEPAIRFEARENLFSVKCIHFQGIASLDITQSGKADSFIGAGAVCRWGN